MDRSHLTRALIAACVASIIAPAFAANAYKCTAEDGSIIFSDTPCSADAKPVSSWDNQTKVDPFWCDKGIADQTIVDHCLDTWRPAFRDPRAAYAEGGRLVAHGVSGKRSIFINAYLRNGFGGINSEMLECDLTTSDEIEATGTADWMRLYRAFAGLDIDRTPHAIRICGD